MSRALVFTDHRRLISIDWQYTVVLVCVPAWLFLSRFIPVLSQMPGVVVIAAAITAAVALDRGPALVAVAITAVGHELLRAPVPWGVHISRMIVVGVIGGVAVALASARTARLVAAQRYRALFERHPLPMFVLDESSLAFLDVNLASLRTYGYSEPEFRRMALRDIYPPEHEPVLDIRQPGQATDPSTVAKHKTKSGQLLDVQLRSQAVPFEGRSARLVLVENITEQRELEMQFRHAQKMEAVGRLAGGIAHDFNNLLTAIRGYASLLLDSLDDQDVRRDDVLEIEKASERATELTRQLLAFSRKQIFQERVLSVNDVVRGIVPMLTRPVGDAVRLRVIANAAGFVKVDAAQLEQVLVNLVVNARDAVQRAGEITIETHDVVLDDLYARTHALAMPGPHVVLAVSDNGQGMTPEVQARAFEPFFTTKPSGEGTGLGLSTVYGIVKQSGGHIWIYSEVGRGTTIKVYLPQTTDATQAAEAVADRARLPMRGAASLLVVEDEENVRGLLKKVLSRSGYTVATAATAAEAKRLIEQDNLQVDLLITDVVLSQESGRDLAAMVEQHRPGARVLYISGYTDDAVVRHGILTEEMPFLQKPFSAAALLEKVAAVLALPSV
jgi:PAS domain S-box-containing protein